MFILHWIKKNNKKIFVLMWDDSNRGIIQISKFTVFFLSG